MKPTTGSGCSSRSGAERSSLAAAVLVAAACRGGGPPVEAPAAAAPTAPAAAPASEAALPFEIVELAPDAVVAIHQPWDATSLLVRTASGAVILVDTPTTPADTAALLDWSEARWGAAPAFAINSHWHADATGGNGVLIDRDAEVISSAHTARLVAERGARMREELVAAFAESDPDTARELRDLRPTPATRPVEVAGRVPLELGGERVELVFEAPSHSPDSIGIFFPARRLLYGGCTVRSDGRIVNRDEADAEGWPRTLEAFAALEPATVIPGHGRRFDPAMIAESLEAARGLAAP